jgi:hypothetical protein
MDQADVDPDLARQLDDAQADEPVEAVLLLHDDDRHAPLDAEALLRRVCQGGDHADMNYMPRMGVLVVRATSQVIRALIVQPEVEIASANHLSQVLHP